MRPLEVVLLERESVFFMHIASEQDSQTGGYSMWVAAKLVRCPYVDAQYEMDGYFHSRSRYIAARRIKASSTGMALTCWAIVCRHGVRN